MGLDIININLKKIIILSLALLILFPVIQLSFSLTPESSAQNLTNDLEHDIARIYGWVVDINTGGPAVNYTVKVTGETYRGNSTVTDASGYYDLFIISGDHTLTISKKNITYESRRFFIDRGTEKRLDPKIDPKMGLYKLSGRVNDEELGIYAAGYTVNLTARDGYVYSTTVTDFHGYYEFIIPRGNYTLRISREGELFKKVDVKIRVQDETLDITIKEIKDEEEYIFAWVTPEQVVSDIISHWWALVLLIILLIVTPIALTYVDKIPVKIDHRKYRLIDEKTVLFLERIVRYNIIIAFAILLLLFLAWLFPGFNDGVWVQVAPHIAAVYTILILFIIMRLLTLILHTGMEYLRGNLAWKPKLKISPRYIGLLDIVLKYMIILIFGINMIVIALAIFGMGDLISEGVSNFFAVNSGYLVFIILILIMMYFSGRFMRSFIDDMKKKDTARFSPEIANMVGKVIKIMIYVLGAMIIIFALLQMGGMGELGQTLILILSIVIGLVVSMAATGSIGNILTSFVLNAFRPFQVGDRVKIGGIIGDVESTNLAFVRLKTLNGETIDIPNNNVIAGDITNYSRSGAFAVTVEVGIGYNVPSEAVKKFMVDAARETKDILDDPRPYVIVTKMGDYAINYLLRAYTNNAKIMFRVRSNLMANVQEQFYSHGVEILSPWYLVRREEKMPTEKETMEAWKGTDEKVEEILTKEHEEKIGGGFDLMDKMESEPTSTPNHLEKS
jgi:small-conductance mechanosensitive channel